MLHLQILFYFFQVEHFSEFFLSCESVLLIMSYPLMIFLYKSWIDSLTSFICLFEFSKSSLQYFFQQFNYRVTFSFQYWRIRSSWRCFKDCSFVLMFLLCFVHLFNRPVFQVFPFIFHFCFICFILYESSQRVTCSWVYALYHYLQGKVI